MKECRKNESEAQALPFDLIILAGPTASGKTAVAVQLAELLRTEIINCDSRQIFKHFTIGTAKPTPEERQRVRHHLLDYLEPWETVNASDYMVQARSVIDALIGSATIPLLVGGTGLYIRAVLQGIFTGPPTDQSFREKLLAEQKNKGQDYLHDVLRSTDPESAERIAPHDVQRILRALEVFALTGKKMSAFQQEHAFSEKPYSSAYLYLKRDRQDLYQRINKRVDWMIDNGWINEVEKLMSEQRIRSSPPMSSIGYRQIADYLTGEIPLELAVELAKRDTRRYAKRQMSWFRKEENAFPLYVAPAEKPEQTVGHIMNCLRFQARL